MLLCFDLVGVMDVLLTVEFLGKSLGFGYEMNDNSPELSEADYYFGMQEWLWENYYEFEDLIDSISNECRNERHAFEENDELFRYVKEKVRKIIGPIVITTTVDDMPSDLNAPYDLKNMVYDMISECVVNQLVYHSES